MLKLEQIQKNAAISGLELGQVVRIVTIELVGLSDNYSALTVHLQAGRGGSPMGLRRTKCCGPILPGRFAKLLKNRDKK
ncbi:MAG TPA: hypothetical protein PK667_05880 [Nitrosomonas europaea]|uniref:hypothetical protein n=1 Tax=Nitrosomonas europaea TaxID=915 RepID=UPI00248FBAC2|nr:hypothetical protein [Nitrosomonas europaea]HRO56081.1 hypothetical protein [Nitrosomonas europaea]HRQ08156.1 hypothetical protein [Nitrosomonas europaea]HUM73717.1 hypothetical protein [Nitrosomonas europaea]